MKTKKIIATVVAGIMALSVLAGCGAGKDSSKIKIKVGNWPTEENTAALEIYDKLKAGFEEANPDFEVIPDTFKFDVKTFSTKAVGKQLPTVFSMIFTEVGNIVKNGYSSDITELAKKHGYDKLNPMGLDYAKDENGHIFGLPRKMYVQGFFINEKLFRDAGLVNGDGTVKVPETYEDIAEYSKIIKEKTGKAGFVYPTTNNCGGWYFMNIAWSFGADFCEQDSNGKWISTFDSPETVAALQYIKDLKWEYNALLDDNVIDQNTVYKYFGTYQGAMTFADPPCGQLVTQYGMNKDDIYVTRMPEGPKGRYAQMGGDLWMFSPDATEAEIDAAMRWLEYTGFTATLSDETLENAKKDYETTVANGGIVLPEATYRLWADDERNQKEDEIRKEYTNVKPENFAGYFGFNGVTTKPEPAACTQQLYAILDGCIQEVITNKDANPAELIKKASEDYQKNHLDKMD